MSNGLVRLSTKRNIYSTIFKTIQDLTTGKTKITSSGLFNGIFKGDFFKAQPIVSESDIAALENYNKLLSNNKPQEAFEQAMNKASVTAQNLAKSAKGAAVDINNIPKASKAAAAGLKLLSVAGNMLLTMGITMAISAIVSGIQKIASAQEDAIAKADEFIAKFNEQRTSLTENKKAIDSMSADYEELAKGVDSLGRNVSLNSDEYARYNDIVNQIADMFPHMIQGYTDEGDAIIAHKGNVEELTKAYEEQKKAAQDAIIVGSADVFKGFKAKVDKDASVSWEETGLIQLQSLGSYLTSIINDQEKVEKFLGNLGNSSYDFNYVQLKDLLTNAGYKVSLNDYDKALKNVKADPQKLRSYLSTISSTIEAEAAKIKPIMQAYLEQSEKFQLADDKVQDMVKQIVGQFDAEFYAQFDSETEMAAWVEENILNKLKNNKDLVNDFGVVFDLQTQFNNNEITLAQYEEKLNAFLSTISVLPEETQKAIKLIFGISEDGYDPNQANKNKILGMLKGDWEKAKEYVGGLTLDELEIGAGLNFKTNSVSIEEFTEALAKAGKEANKTTVSLSELEKVSDNIKPLGTAFKELSDDGYITIKTLKEMKDAADLSSEEWAEYEGKLLNAKVGSSEFNRVMSDLTYKILDNTFAGKELNNLTEQQIAAVLRENGVVNASAVAHDWLAKAKAKEKIASMELVKGSKLDVAALISEASACGVAKNAYLELVAKEILFNRNDLDIEDKVKKLNQIAVAAGVAGISMDDLNSKFGSESEKRKYIEENGGKITTTTASYTSPYISPITNPLLQLPGMQTEGSDIPISPYISPITNPLLQLPGMQTKQIIEYEFSDGTKTTDINEALMLVEMGKVVERITNAANNITFPNYSGAAKDSDKNEALDNYLKDAENRYKIHQDETKYIKELRWAHDNLTKSEKERLDITGKINEAYRDLADNQIKDIEHQIDLVKELYGEDADVTGYYDQIQNIAHKEANRYREFARKELGYYEDGVSDEQKSEIDAIIEKTNEIQDLQKTWWDAQKSKVDWRWDNSNNWIDERNTYNDWNLFDDSEVKAWERIIKWLNEDYPNDLEKIKEAEKNLFEARKKEFDKGTGFGNTYLDSRKTLLQSYYDVTNAIAEAQHEINKELETSKTMYEYLDEDTRKLLFNQDDYNDLSEELLDIQYRADKLQRQYNRELNNATLDTIESITSNYQMQYETLMKSYEIAKADLEIAKKKQKLNNVLNERKVRMFINGSWQWVANTEDVANAKSELADAEYAKRVEEAGLTQQQSINNLTKQQDELGVVIKKFESGVIDLGEAIKQAEKAIGNMPNTLASIFNNAKGGTSSSYSSGSTVYGGNSGGGSNSSYISWAKSQMAENSKNWHTADENGKRALEAANQSLGNAIGSTFDSETGTWKHKYATGTKYTQSGSALMGEKGEEFYISANGRFIPITQPTIGNIPGGGVVFNREQMKNLRTMWDMSNLNFKGGSDIVSTAQPQQIDQSQDNRIIINGMTVDSGSADGQALISALRRYIGNH